MMVIDLSPPVVETAGALEIKPPSDARVLFYGTNLDAWLAGGGKNPPPWEVRDGVMIAKEKNIRSKQRFGAVQVHFEWRLPADRKVNGQSVRNSGVFFMGLHESQLFQSHNNQTYPDGQAASLYRQLPPLVNATSPQGEWNSYDITLLPPVYEDGKVITPAKVMVIHNGVVAQNGESYIGPSVYRKLTKYPKYHPEIEPLVLQFHGDPLEYRNFWVRSLGKGTDLSIGSMGKLHPHGSLG